MTPRRLEPAEYRLLLRFGIGLTDVTKDQSGSDAQLAVGRSDRTTLREKLRRFAPRLVCFNGKRAARVFLGRPELAYGIQPETCGRTRLFVAPSTSGAANASWDLGVWQALAEQVKAGGIGGS